MKELIHESISAEPGDWIRLQFPGRTFVEVQVLSWTRESMTVENGDRTFEMESVEVPFDVKNTSMGHVSGKFMCWRMRGHPDSAPCMIVCNMGTEWKKE